MKSLIIISVLFSLNTFANTGKRVFLQPLLGINYSKWNQKIDSSPITGTLAGNTYGYFYGANLSYKFTPTFNIGYGYKNQSLTWLYANSKNYAVDDSWPKSSKATETTHEIALSYQNNRSMVSLYYIVLANLQMDDYYITQFRPAKFSGNGFGLKLTLPLGSFFNWGIDLRQTSYNKATLNGTKIDMPGTLDDYTFNKKSIQTILLDLSFPLGLF